MAVTIMIGAARGIHSALLKPYGLRRERERDVSTLRSFTLGLHGLSSVIHIFSTQ
jgi:hypothetical protein